jgi:hypothetical protein
MLVYRFDGILSPIMLVVVRKNVETFYNKVPIHTFHERPTVLIETLSYGTRRDVALKRLLVGAGRASVRNGTLSATFRIALRQSWSCTVP